ALLDQVDDLAGGRVEPATLLPAADVADDDRALEATVVRDLAKWLLERTTHDPRAGPLVGLAERVEVERLLRRQQGDTATGHDALLERRPSRLQRVLDAMLLLLHLGLGSRPDLDHGNPARQLGKTLLELLLIEVRIGVLDLGLDLVDATLDRVALAGAIDDRRGVLGDDHATSAAELRDLRVLELEAHLLGDHLAAREDRDVLEHALTAIAEARSLDRDAGERAAELVDHERRERLALDILGDDQQRLARLDRLLQNGQQ